MLKITRNQGETWLECALRYAKPYGLESEVTTEYKKWEAQGYSADECAMFACEEWDIVDFDPANN